MAEKNMTQVQAMEFAIDRLREIEGDWAELDDAIAVIENMVAKRKAPRKPRVNKEVEAFRKELLGVLAVADEPMTNAELTAAINEKLGTEYKPQKVANNMRVLEKNGVTVRIRGEKASDKDRFAMA